MRTPHSERSPVHAPPMAPVPGRSMRAHRHPSGQAHARHARRVRAPAPERSRMHARALAPPRSRSLLTCVLTCSSVLITSPQLRILPTPSLPSQIRHTYTHAPAMRERARRAALREHSEFPQLSSMITANSDIRDNAVTCGFTILVYRFRA